MAEVYSAAEKRDWETVEVRRPLEAIFSSECGPSRAVRLGLVQRPLQAVVARRNSAMLCRIHPHTPRHSKPAGNFEFRMQALLHADHDANSRGSCAPLPYCLASQFLAAARLADARAASGMGSTPSPLGVLFPLTFTNTKRGRPSGRDCCFCFRVPVWSGGTLWCPPPRPGPAVHRDGCTALHEAAIDGNRRIIRLLIAAKAAVDARDDFE